MILNIHLETEEIEAILRLIQGRTEQIKLRQGLSTYSSSVYEKAVQQRIDEAVSLTKLKVKLQTDLEQSRKTPIPHETSHPGSDPLQ